MKKTIVVFAIAALAACNGSSTEQSADSVSVKTDSIAAQVDSAAVTADSTTAKIPADSTATK